MTQLLVDPTDYLELPQDLILSLLTKSISKGSGFVLQGWTSQASTKSAAQMVLLDSAVSECSHFDIEGDGGQEMVLEDFQVETEPVSLFSFALGLSHADQDGVPRL